MISFNNFRSRKRKEKHLQIDYCRGCERHGVHLRVLRAGVFFIDLADAPLLWLFWFKLGDSAVVGHGGIADAITCGAGRNAHTRTVNRAHTTTKYPAHFTRPQSHNSGYARWMSPAAAPCTAVDEVPLKSAMASGAPARMARGGICVFSCVAGSVFRIQG